MWERNSFAKRKLIVPVLDSNGTYKPDSKSFTLTNIKHMFLCTVAALFIFVDGEDVEL